MSNNTEAIRLLINDMSTSDAGALHKWLGKLLPKKAETEDPDMSSAALWWLTKLRSGNVLPGIGWPTMLPVDDLGRDYIETLRRKLSTRGNVTAMGRFLNSVGAREEKKPSLKIEVTIRPGEPGGEGLRPGATITRMRRRTHYIFFGLEKCRDGFERKYGKQEWPGAQACAPEGDSDAADGD